jgi:protein phosphatase 1 regulatory subunit 7
MPLSVTHDAPEDPPDQVVTSSKPRDSHGWDGKLRVAPKQAVLANPEALTDPDYSDPENVSVPVEQIEADEDLLDEYPVDTEDIDLVHCRISSIPALRLERFTRLKQLCLRQNQISELDLPSSLGASLLELDLYDNLISHIKGFDELPKLTSLDLSFNKIKHIKHVNHLKQLRELYFVQNRIQKIENLDGLDRLTMIELAANRIRDIENLETLTALEELWLGKNKITEIKNLYSLTNIRVLDISNNQISKLENLSHLTHLQEFWASSNRLSSFQEVEQELRDKAELETVYFEGNPLQTQGPAVYRNKVRLALPQVQQIDASELSFSTGDGSCLTPVQLS